MPRCRTVQATLTAWIDGELSHRRAEGIRRHVTACASCTAEAVSLRDTIEAQRRMLPVATTVQHSDPEVLWMRLQRAYTSRPDEVGHHGGYGWPRWRWLLPPVAVAGVALVLLMLSWIVGPSDVLIPLGVKPPPVAVTREPGFFKDYPLIEHLDVLEHFDTVESEPLDDDQQAQRG